MQPEIKTPEELKQKLITLFPSFVDEYETEDDTLEFWHPSPLTFHKVWMDFASVAYENLIHAREKELTKFGELINMEVAAGADNENAVSTCFLEHASQVSVRKLIKPFLSAEARKELR